MQAPKPDGVLEDDEAWQAEQNKIDTAKPLTPEELVGPIYSFRYTLPSHYRLSVLTVLGAQGSAAAAGL
jgi:hypothetical protein